MNQWIHRLWSALYGGEIEQPEMKPENPEHRRRLLIFSWKDILKCVCALAVTTGIGLLFQRMGFTEANIITIYILNILLISILTENQIYSLIASIVSVFIFNFLFTEPRYTFLAYEQGYPVTFLVMFLASLITGSLTAQVKRSARKSAQAMMLAKNEQLRANLLRAISHDLRTPLTSISGNASNLMSNADQFDETVKQQIYSDIYEESIWLIRLVENLLAVTRIEEGRMDFRFSAELMDEVVAEALQHVDRRRTEHTITVENEDEFLMARMDVRLIVQVVINMVDNAIKYTPEGSHIKIRIRKAGDWVRVEVADDGPGISDEDKARVFEMFYSGSGKIADDRRSLGLGLSLCQSIIVAHGGEIGVEDGNPHGAVFYFTLPAEEVQLHE